jgi:hypothetical protein
LSFVFVCHFKIYVGKVSIVLIYVGNILVYFVEFEEWLRIFLKYEASCREVWLLLIIIFALATVVFILLQDPL